MKYSLEVAGLPPGEIILRCLIILWTGDYPGQCEVGKFMKSGIQPCRRDKLKGIGLLSSLFCSSLKGVVRKTSKIFATTGIYDYTRFKFIL